MTTSVLKQKATYELPVLGLRCPEPMMLMRKKMRTMKVGESLLLITDDAATLRDIPDYCRFMEHTLIDSHTSDSPFFFLLQKES